MMSSSRSLLLEEDEVPILVDNACNAAAGSSCRPWHPGRHAFGVIELPPKLVVIHPCDQCAAVGSAQGEHAGSVTCLSRSLDLARRQQLALVIQASEIDFILLAGRPD